MKVLSYNTLKTLGLSFAIATGGFALGNTSKAQAPIAQPILSQPVNDLFVPSGRSVPKSGTASPKVLKYAPSPVVNVAGKKKIARVVVDISNNVLYMYDKRTGEPEVAYPVATGASSTPTHTGLRLVSHVENYPYSSADGTKRKKNPDDYGPNVFYLMILNSVTGELDGSNGEFLHGTKSEDAIGKKVTHGCIRLPNKVVKDLAETGQIKSGDIVRIMKNE